MNLLEELRLKIKAVADAYDIPYDGDEGKHAHAVSESGIDLDDFVMINGHDLDEQLGRLWNLVDRAYKIMEQAGYRVAEHNPDHNNPIIAWMADARVALQDDMPHDDIVESI